MSTPLPIWADELPALPDGEILADDVLVLTRVLPGGERVSYRVERAVLEAALLGSVSEQVGQVEATADQALVDAASAGAAAVATQAALSDHEARQDNPHGVTAAQIGAAPAVHGHTMDEVTGLATALEGKVGNDDPRLVDSRPPTAHDHAVADVAGLQAALDAALAAAAASQVTANAAEESAIAANTNADDAYVMAQIHAQRTDNPHGVTAAQVGAAPVSHGHTMGQVSGLDAALAGKAATVHGHAVADVTGLSAALAAKAEVVHEHTVAEVDGLAAALADAERLEYAGVWEAGLPFQRGAIVRIMAPDDHGERGLYRCIQAHTSSLATRPGPILIGERPPIWWADFWSRIRDVELIPLDQLEPGDPGTVLVNNEDGEPVWLVLTPAMLGAAPAAHTHGTADVTGLDAALASMATTGHTHALTTLTSGAEPEHRIPEADGAGGVRWADMLSGSASIDRRLFQELLWFLGSRNGGGSASIRAEGYRTGHGPGPVSRIWTGTGATGNADLTFSEVGWPEANGGLSPAGFDVAEMEVVFEVPVLSDETNTFRFFVGASSMRQINDGNFAGAGLIVDGSSARTFGKRSSTESTGAAAFTIAASQLYHCRIRWVSGSHVEAWINGTSLGTVTTNLPTGAPVKLGVNISKTAGTTDRSVYLCNEYGFWKRNT